MAGGDRIHLGQHPQTATINSDERPCEPSWSTCSFSGAAEPLSFDIPTSICRRIFTICSGVCFLGLPIPCSFHTSLSHPYWYRICWALHSSPDFTGERVRARSHPGKGCLFRHVVILAENVAYENATVGCWERNRTLAVSIPQETCGRFSTATILQLIGSVLNSIFPFPEVAILIHSRTC